MTPSNIQFYKINTWEDYLTRNPEQLNTVLPQLMLFCANREFDHFFTIPCGMKNYPSR